MLYSEELKKYVICKIQTGTSIEEIKTSLNISENTINEWLNEKTKENEIIKLDSIDMEYKLRQLINEIKDLTNQKKYDIALELCNTNKGKHSIRIQTQKVKVLLRMFEENNNKELLDEALSICDKNVGNQIFEQYKIRINVLIKKEILNNLTTKAKIKENNNLEITTLLTNIYFGTISKEEIDNSNINDWEKSLLLLSYYDKNDKKQGINFIKELKKQNQIKEENKKILNLIYERLISKKHKIFDVSLYTKYLKCTINSNLIKKESKEEIKIDLKQEKNIEKPKVEKIEIKEKKQIVAKNTQVSFSRHNQPTNLNKAKTNEENHSKKVIKQIKIKDLFPNEVLEIQKNLYLEMNSLPNYENVLNGWDELRILLRKTNNNYSQNLSERMKYLFNLEHQDLEKQNKAMKAWDNFEYLINKPSDDKIALERMKNLLKKLYEINFFTNIEKINKPKQLNKEFK